MMPRHLLSTTAAALMLTGAAWAQTELGAGADEAATPRNVSGPQAAQATGPSSASESDPWDTDAAAIVTEDDARVLADRIIGLPVLTEDGEQVGDVEELIVDRSRRVRGVVVAVGGFLGLGVKEVGVAWDQAEVRSSPETGEALILRGLTSDDIDAAPSLETDTGAESASQDLDSRSADQAPSTPPGASAR